MASEQADQFSTAPEIYRLDAGEIVVPLHTEDIAISKRVVPKNRVQIATVTRRHDECVEELLAREQVEIERTPIGKEIDVMPPVREEGDVIIVPVVEEVLVVARKLMLKEEVRIRRVRNIERYQETVMLRKQEAIITRQPVEESTATSG
jgi:stress response protein YsnF